MTNPPECANCGEVLGTGDTVCPKCGTPRPGSTPPSPSIRGATQVLSGAAMDQAPPPPSMATPTPPPIQESPPSAEEPPPPEEDFDGWQEVRQQLEEATRGDFEILRELGRGGMAAVYLAKDLTLGRNVAIKVMAPGLLMGAGMVDRFRQEAVTIANLHHPNIVTIHTVGQAGHLHFFVMQVVEGGSLEGILERNEPIPIHLIQVVLYQLGVGLAYAHRRGVIHRDIKPANVLLDQEGNAILTDFGIAKVTTASNLTQTGSTMGTPAYMSPEQCKAAQLTDASDQYSLGVVAYEMLTGAPPFSGSPFEIMQAHTADLPPSILEKRPDCPPELETAVLRMMAKEPGDRFPNVADAVEAIGGYLPGPQDPIRAELVQLITEGSAGIGSDRGPLKPTPGRGATPTPSSRRETISQKLRSRIPFWITGVVIVATLITVAISTLMSGEEERTEPVPPPPASVHSISFANAREEILAGTTIQIQANIQDSLGRILPEEPVEWASTDPSVATVEGTAREVTVTGVGPGTATIFGRAGGVEGSLEILVTAPAAGELSVSTPSRELLVGAQLDLTAILTDETGARVENPEVNWVSSNPGVASVDAQTGVVTGQTPGRTQIRATSGEESGSVTLSVVGRVEQVTVNPVQGPLQAGGIAVVRTTVVSLPAGYLGGDGLSWTSSNPGVASVTFADADSVVLTLLSPGETVLAAEAGGVQGILTLRVEEPPEEITLNVSPGSVEFAGVEGRASPDPQSVAILVTGDATAGVGSVEYGGQEGGWLTPSISSQGGGSERLTLSVELEGLTPGVFTAQVPVQAGSETRFVAVTLTVEEDPANAPVEPNDAAFQAISNLIAQYAAAINAKDAARVKEIFPSLPDGAMNDLMQIRDSDTYVLNLVPGSLRTGPEERTLEGQVLSSVLGPGGRGEARGMIYTFSRGAEGWFIVSLRASE